MKKFIICFLFCGLMFTQAHAETSVHEHCKSISNTAGLIMELRQKGVAMSAVMEIIINSDDSAAKNLYSHIIMTAYDSPRYSSDSYIKKAIEDFINLNYLFCMQALSD